MNASFQLPEAFSSVLGLGTPKAWHPVKKKNRVGNLVLLALLSVGGLLVFLYGLYDTYLAYQRHGPAMIDDRLVAPLLIALVLFLLASLVAWGLYANWNRSVALFDRGFASRDRKGVKTWTWEEVLSFSAAVTRHYTNGIYTGTTHIYTLVNNKKERLVLSDALRDVENLAQAIEQGIFPILYDRAAAQYNSGQTVNFGPLMINKSGIMIGRKNYPWSEVQQVSIHQGFVKVSKKGGGWFSGASALASTIPNLRVCLSLVDQVIGLKT